MPAPKPPLSQPAGFVSDIHGNLPALDAVLGALRERGVSNLYVAGDLLFGGDQPLEVWMRLREVHATCIRGLSDKALSTIDPSTLAPSSEHEQAMAERFTRTRTSVGELVLAHLRHLPEQLRVPLVDGRELVLVHGSPSDPGQEMTHDMDDEELNALIADDPADIVVCGASHVPFQREVGECYVVNVGSVGAAPEGHVAHFTVITPKMGAADIEQSFVPYD